MALCRSVLRLSLILLLLHVPSGRGAVHPIASCCLKTQDTKVPLERLVDYRMQNAVCEVEAVQIKTVMGRTICSDPSSPWAQRAMRYLYGKKMAKAATPLTSTTAITAQLNEKATAASRIEDTTELNEKATAASRFEDTTKQNKKATAASRIEDTTKQNKKATAASRIEDTTKQNKKVTAASRIEDTTKQNKKVTAASKIEETQVLPVGKITVCVRDPDAL